MKKIWNHLDQYRIQKPGMEFRSGNRFGVFIIPFDKVLLRTIATDGIFDTVGLGPEFAWEHVSVSLPDRCPTWEEMDFIKDKFWDPDECVMQLHVPKADHKNFFPYCLHLWRPLMTEIPRPPHSR